MTNATASITVNDVLRLSWIDSKIADILPSLIATLKESTLVISIDNYSLRTRDCRYPIQGELKGTVRSTVERLINSLTAGNANARVSCTQSLTDLCDVLKTLLDKQLSEAVIINTVLDRSVKPNVPLSVQEFLYVESKIVKMTSLYGKDIDTVQKAYGLFKTYLESVGTTAKMIGIMTPEMEDKVGAAVRHYAEVLNGCHFDFNVKFYAGIHEYLVGIYQIIDKAIESKLIAPVTVEPLFTRQQEAQLVEQYLTNWYQNNNKPVKAQEIQELAGVVIQHSL
jgi:hypothetical protein